MAEVKDETVSDVEGCPERGFTRLVPDSSVALHKTDAPGGSASGASVFRRAFMAEVKDETVSEVDGCPEWYFTCDLEIDYGSEQHAWIIHAALAVDKELQPEKVRRKMSVSNGRLSVHFEALEARLLRASFSSFVDLVTLATQTMEEFDTAQKNLIVSCDQNLLFL